MNITVRSTTDDATVEYRIDGVAPDDGDDEPEDPGTTEHDIEITGETDDHVEYEFEVTGIAEFGPNANTDEDDEYRETVDDDRTAAAGHLGGGTDDWRFTGEIVTFRSSGGEVTVRIDGEEVDPETLNRQPSDDGTEWTIEDSTADARQHVQDGTIRDFTQTGGESDWVLEVDGMPVAFGGPTSPVGGEFSYATRAQVTSFVECTIDNLELDLDLDTYVRKDELGSYVQSGEVEDAIQSAFENADVSLTTSGIELSPPEE